MRRISFSLIQLNDEVNGKDKGCNRKGEFICVGGDF